MRRLQLRVPDGFGSRHNVIVDQRIVRIRPASRLAADAAPTPGNVGRLNALEAELEQAAEGEAADV